MKRVVTIISIFLSLESYSQVLENPVINGNTKPGIFWIDTISKEVKQRIALECLKIKLDTVVNITNQIESNQDSSIFILNSIITKKDSFINKCETSVSNLNSIINKQSEENKDLRKKLFKSDKNKRFWRNLSVILGTTILTGTFIIFNR